MTMLGAPRALRESPFLFVEEPSPLDLALATGASVRSETAQRIASREPIADAPAIQLSRGPLRNGGDLVVTLTPCLGSQYVPRTKHDQLGQHQRSCPLRDEMTALIAVATTTPPTARAAGLATDLAVTDWPFTAKDRPFSLLVIGSTARSHQLFFFSETFIARSPY
jgi:hypothetical protein